jgi:hypothetical protein
LIDRHRIPGLALDLLPNPSPVSISLLFARIERQEIETAPYVRALESAA